MRPLEMVERMAARMPISISMMASIVAANSFFSICLARLANSERVDMVSRWKILCGQNAKV